MYKKYRTIKTAYEEIVAMDPQTAITENFIRDICRNGLVPIVKAGSKYLIDLDDLFEYLSEYADRKVKRLERNIS